MRNTTASLLQSLFTLILVLFIIAVAGYGWFENVVKLTEIATVFSPMFVVRLIGIFVVPLGAILGYC